MYLNYIEGHTIQGHTIQGFIVQWFSFENQQSPIHVVQPQLSPLELSLPYLRDFNEVL